MKKFLKADDNQQTNKRAYECGRPDRVWREVARGQPAPTTTITLLIFIIIILVIDDVVDLLKHLLSRFNWLLATRKC
jgi:hypothetical protein